MKRMLLFAFLAISFITVSSCKKSKAPAFDGPSNLVSGKWHPNLSNVSVAAGVIIPVFKFGTDYNYEKVYGNTNDPHIERGTYTTITLENPDAHSIILKPRGGAEYTIQLKEYKDSSAIFRYGEYQVHPFRYNRK
ncbi:hypothetical protein [Chitinophaga deserti]|uniref:hypothetical protein n=1 Tax=Chitinophaga deserti TaxID=2164099 RepID=UPI000D6B6D7E|nr:hypothetical protein [Chitinophaga deserti]